MPSYQCMLKMMVKGSSKWGSSTMTIEQLLEIYEAGKSNLSSYQARHIKRVIVSGKRCAGITSDDKIKRGGGTTSDQKNTNSISKKDMTISKKDTTRLNAIIDEANTVLKKYKRCSKIILFQYLRC